MFKIVGDKSEMKTAVHGSKFEGGGGTWPLVQTGPSCLVQKSAGRRKEVYQKTRELAFYRTSINTTLLIKL
jgi:hypothetical protein